MNLRNALTKAAQKYRRTKSNESNIWTDEDIEAAFISGCLFESGEALDQILSPEQDDENAA